jgi:hypothetical protein
MLSPQSYQSFKDAVVQLPAESALEAWMEKHNFRHRLITNARILLHDTIAEYHSIWRDTHPQALAMLNKIKNQLENSYV